MPVASKQNVAAEAMVYGYHMYMEIWWAKRDEIGNNHQRSHVPSKISSVLLWDSTISWKVTNSRRYSQGSRQLLVCVYTSMPTTVAANRVCVGCDNLQ